MREIPNIFNRKQGPSKRSQAIAMYLAGKNKSEVKAALDMCEASASAYLTIARNMVRDPLLD